MHTIGSRTSALSLWQQLAPTPGTLSSALAAVLASYRYADAELRHAQRPLGPWDQVWGLQEVRNGPSACCIHGSLSWTGLRSALL